MISVNILKTMKKFLFYLISILLCSSGITACETDEDFVQEHELIISSDTTLVSDTIILPDTTIMEGDTIIKNDTIINNNSIISQDTINYSGLDISYYMRQESGYSNIQGADCYGDYLFQFVHSNSKVYIYNLDEKTLTDVAVLPSNTKNHCNNVSFSNVYYNENDTFPLLYVSGSPSETYNHVQVYRVVTNEDKITLQKVQEITLPPSSSKNQLYWTGAVMDNENNFMYVYANGQKAQITKFSIPDINQMEVQLTDNDILEQFSVSGFTHQQGACIKDNLLYVMDGVPQWGDTNYLRIIDLKTKKDIKKINISDYGYRSIEFESISRYKDFFILGTYNRGLYSLKLNLNY